MSDFIKYNYDATARDTSLQVAREHYEMMSRRRSIREYSDKAVDRAVIEQIVLTAATAPSGAHKQPWSFAAISSSEMKQKVRQAAEAEEYKNYHGRMNDEWLDDLAPFGTDWHKPFLTTAPWLIVVFKQIYGFDSNLQKTKHYYVTESVGIAAGILIGAIHNAGLVTLTHTPSPMNFLETLLERPQNEKAFLLLPVGYPAEGVMVPDIERKSAESVITYY